MLDKKYDHLKVEKGKYENWKNKGYFEAGDITKKPYAIVIPPPNVTGKLHIGHAWDTALQDIIIRYKKLKGFDTLWVPGMDHAGIATQAKVDKRLRDEGIDPRSMNREEWLKAAWAWKDEYANNIHEQWAKLGLALDYSKERFTLDEGLSKAVKKVFVDLYNKGLIYRGERIINWDPVQLTALSNEEVIYKEEEGTFYHLKYYIEGKDEYIDVATTRPETLFGDTAVAVNKDDKRYKKLIGKNVILPIVGRKIPIIADEHADMTKGSGAVKITGAHDPNDFEVSQRHNLKNIVVMNQDATMNENAGKYQGLNRFECREKLLEELKEKDLLIKEEKIIHSVGHSERSDAIVEPYLSKQWFVKMDVLAQNALKNQKDKDKKVKFYPERFEKTLNHWLEISHDWCISRQLWWGHRIPAWYKDDKIYVGLESPKEEGWIQDPDTLDTWFSSALWPFSTLGWPDNTELYQRYYPNDVLIAGFDIIFFWVSRMIFQGLEFTKTKPFKNCLIHGLVRDNIGRKMSKSLGNGVDPMDEIEKYGADSLRFFLTTSSAPGMDVKYEPEKVKSTWNFINKLWNASRFVLLNIEGYNETYENLKLQDKWILTRLNETVKEVTENMEKYEFNLVGATLYNFIWNDFCDWYIELSKLNMNDTSKTVLVHVLKSILIMMHPFMPYVTEEIYTKLPNTEESIMLSKYPEYNQKEVFKESSDLEEIIDLIKKIRKARLENNIKENYIEYKNEVLINNKEIIDKMTKNVNINNYKSLDTLKFNFKGEIVTLYYDNSSNETAEIERLYKEKERLENSILRREKLLSNENYVNKAPKEIVETERKTLEKEKQELEIIIQKLK